MNWNFLRATPILERTHVRVEEWRYNRDGEELAFDVGIVPDAAMVVAITNDEQVLFLKHFFVSQKAVATSIVAGRCEDGEDAIETARRELLEEAGCEAAEFSLLCSVARNKWETGKIHVVLATGVDKVADQQLDATEDIEPFFVSKEKAVAMLRNGEIGDSYCVMALYRAFDALSLL